MLFRSVVVGRQVKVHGLMYRIFVLYRSCRKDYIRVTNHRMSIMLMGKINENEDYNVTLIWCANDNVNDMMMVNGHNVCVCVCVCVCCHLIYCDNPF